jgi:hypothetical protein
MKQVIAFFILVALAAPVSADSWQDAEENGKITQQVVHFCNRFVEGWLTHADPKSGLFPRNLKTDFHWNARDSAADNYPFMVLTAHVTGNHYMMKSMRDILEAERRLTCRLDSLPDDFLFATQGFRAPEYKIDDLIFGAAEYCKDGLIPITEWIGPSPWLDRMSEMVKDIWKHAPHDSPVGKIPTQNVEVAGDLLQTMSRLYWLTGEEDFKTWAFLLADLYLLHDNIPQWDRLRLDDHGCEIIGGLSEAYYIASRKDPGRREKYKPRLYAALDRVLEVGGNADGLLYNVVDAQSGKVISEEFTDNWGYNYNAFLTVAEVDGETRYREAVVKVMSNIHKYLEYKWENGGADGYADSIEGCINLLNRVWDESAAGWIDDSMKILLAKQDPDGIIEGWHGDGNSARTSIMYALWKTQGISLSPWREDLQVGAVKGADGSVSVSIQCAWPWSGLVRFDRPRHSEYFHIPTDYARLNQFPEWFTAQRDKKYKIAQEGTEGVIVPGQDLWSYPAEASPDKPLRLVAAPSPE